ncbi:MAG: 4Fe-4S binding protein [Desulfuromonadales bacterium]|nr:4Fe-4S binding protein [Desulfuromonadales bacterium]
MMRTAHLIYFSPTGTSKIISTGIARGLAAKNITHYDLTRPNPSFELVLTDGVAIIATPVYAGRVPELFLQRFQGITSKGMPAILVVLYGNREFEDALVELRDVSIVKGFNVIAAGAFIGEHSYSTRARPIAVGRPNAEDLKLAARFGKQGAAKIERNDFNLPGIDGNVPYKKRIQLGGVAPETDDSKCTLCGRCAAVCPAGIIAVSNSVKTYADSCIMCCACIKECDFEARTFNHPQIEEKRVMLQKNCSTPKAPAIYL